MVWLTTCELKKLISFISLTSFSSGPSRHEIGELHFSGISLRFCFLYKDPVVEIPNWINLLIRCSTGWSGEFS